MSYCTEKEAIGILRGSPDWQSDDVTTLKIDSGNSLQFSLDTAVMGVHCPLTATPAQFVERAVRIAVSDLAACGGAVPMGYEMALTLPEYNTEWLRNASVGLRNIEQGLQIELRGGDLVRSASSPPTATVAVYGQLPYSRHVGRRAQLGDDLWVTGVLGCAQAYIEGYDVCEQCIQRFWAPEPRIDLARSLAPYMSACIDISDGIDASIDILSSGVGSVVRRAMPWCECLKGATRNNRPVYFGKSDDYELLFSASRKHRGAIAESGIQVTHVAVVVDNNAERRRVMAEQGISP